MKFLATPLAGLTEVHFEPRQDERGSFSRAFCQKEFAAAGLSNGIAQANTSFSHQRGTLRGMHYQLAPAAESKFIRCLRGSVYDVALDLRADSPTFGQSFGLVLTPENLKGLFIPKGFAHGFLTLEDNSEVLYLVDEFYSPELERGIRWNDPCFQIAWPEEPRVLSPRDLEHPDYQRP